MSFYTLSWIFLKRKNMTLLIATIRANAAKLIIHIN